MIEKSSMSEYLRILYLPKVIDRKIVVSKHVITKSFLVFISAAFSCKLMSLRQALIDRRKYATASVNVGATKSFSKTNVMSNL